MNNLKLHIIISMFFIGVLKLNSFGLSSLVCFKINHSELKQIGKKDFFNKYNLTKDSLRKITSICVEEYVGDSVIITPEDFPSLHSIEFKDLSPAAINFKGLSKFKQLTTLKISFHHKYGINTNISEVFKCFNLEYLSIEHKYPIKIDLALKNLVNLKELRISQIANPEVILNVPNWSRIFKILPLEEQYINFLLLCKLSNISANELIAMDSNIFNRYRYDFSLDSAFTIYNTEGVKVCSGAFKDKKRIGIWEYYFPKLQLGKRLLYSTEGNLLAVSEIVYFENSRTFIQEEILANFNIKNSETHFNFTTSRIYCKNENDTIICDTSEGQKLTQMYDSVKNILFLYYHSNFYSMVDFENNIRYSYELNDSGNIIKIMGGDFYSGTFWYEKTNGNVEHLKSINCVDCFNTSIIKQLLHEVKTFKALEEYFK